MTRQEWLLYGTKRMEEAKIADAREDAWLLLSHVTGLSKIDYTLERGTALTETEEKKLAEALEQRLLHVPVQQIIGEAWFMGYPFLVNEHVLTPRLDTEVLIEAVLKRLPAVPVNAEGKRRLLDMCTGSGCILLSLLKEADGLCGAGVDVSPEALQVAKKNSERLETAAAFIESDLFADVTGRYELIVSNPPYIVRDVIPTLDAEVREHEPVLALDGGTDGLDFYRRIVQDAREYLVPGGLLAFEIGYDQGEALLELMKNAGYGDVELLKDLAGLDRVALGWKSRLQEE